MNKLWTALVALVILAPVYGQLYLVTGSQSPKGGPEGFASVLFQVGSGGEVRRVEEIAPRGEGTWLIETSYDARKLVTFSPSYQGIIEARTVVVDFDKGRVVKTCAWPSGYNGFQEWMADVHVKGISMLQQRVDANGREIGAMSMDPSVPCGESFDHISLRDVKSMALDGEAGVAGLASNEIFPFGMDRDGKIFSRSLGGEMVYFGFRIPEELRAGLDRPVMSVMINNSKVLVVWVGVGAPRVLVFRKSDQTWHRLPSPYDRYDGGRSFEHYLAIPEAHTKGPAFPESAGSAEWRKDESAMGPSIAGAFANWPRAYTGKLHLYDMNTEKVFTIETKQGDSEVLLIENGTVYYRASDRLYSASITDKGIGAASLIATDEAIRDVHWAFIKR